MWIVAASLSLLGKEKTVKLLNCAPSVGFFIGQLTGEQLFFALLFCLSFNHLSIPYL